MKEIEIFRAGTYKKGSLTFTEGDIRALSESYDPVKMQAPLTLDHIHTGKSYGWVRRVFSRGATLFAELEDVSPELTEMVRRGEYRTVSAEIYPAGHPDSPAPETLYLKAVSFLGAQIPAVKGLAPAEFAEGALCFGEEIIIDKSNEEDKNMDELEKAKAELLAREAEIERQKKQIAEFSEGESKKDEEIRKLREENARAVHAGKVREFQTFAEELTAEGKLPPKLKEKVVYLLDALDQMGVRDYSIRIDGTVVKSGEFYTFSEGGAEKKPEAVLREILSGLPKVMEFSETVAGGVSGDLADRALAISQEKGVGYREALKMAQGGK